LKPRPPKPLESEILKQKKPEKKGRKKLNRKYSEDNSENELVTKEEIKENKELKIKK